MKSGHPWEMAHEYPRPTSAIHRGIVIGILFLLSSCEEPQKREVTFPTQLDLTDASGKSISAKILGKSGEELAIQRPPSERTYIIAVSSLSPASATRASSLPDSDPDAFSQFRSEVKLSHARAQRVVKWHNDFETAQAEAQELELPLLVLHLGAGDSNGDRLDRDYFNSSSFRDWAKDQLILFINRGSAFDETVEQELSLVEERFKLRRTVSQVILLDSDSSSSSRVALKSSTTPESLQQDIEQKLQRLRD